MVVMGARAETSFEGAAMNVLVLFSALGGPGSVLDQSDPLVMVW